MKRHVQVGLTFVIGAVAGTVIGGIVGTQLATNMVVSEWAKSEARNSIEVVEILRHLHAGREGDGMAALGLHLDRHVFGLMPSAREGIDLSDSALEEVNEAATVARDYREEHPHSGDTLLERDVKEFLQSVKP